MMTNCGPDRHQLQQYNDHNVMGRVEGLKLTQVVAILNINGVRVVVCPGAFTTHAKQTVDFYSEVDEGSSDRILYSEGDVRTATNQDSAVTCPWW
jgi:hypothetical protein